MSVPLIVAILAMVCFLLAASNFNGKAGWVGLLLLTLYLVLR